MPYVRPVAPETFTHVPSAWHRCHWYWNELALGLHAPFVTVSVPPGVVLAGQGGPTVFDGPFAEPMTPVGPDVAEAEPSAFFAVTTTRIVWCTAVEVRVYVLLGRADDVAARRAVSGAAAPLVRVGGRAVAPGPVVGRHRRACLLRPGDRRARRVGRSGRRRNACKHTGNRQ